MKSRIVFFVLILSMLAFADTLTLNWDGQTTKEVDTLTFNLTAGATCDGQCGGSFRVYFTHSDSLTELNKREHSCYSTNSTSYSCSFSPEFKVFRWKYEPYILIQAKSEPRMSITGNPQEAISVQSEKITIVRKPGTLEGTIFLDNNIANITFSCKTALCMGVKLSTNLGGEFECGDMDKNSAACSASFAVDTSSATELKGIATTIIPSNATFYTNVIKLQNSQSSSCTAENCDKCLTKEECNAITECSWWISGTPPRCVPAKDNPDLPVSPPLVSKNVFQIIWEWILSLFGIKS